MKLLLQLQQAAAIIHAIKHTMKLLLQLQQAAAIIHKRSPARLAQLLHKANEGCNSCASLPGLISCFIAAACCSCNYFKF